MRFYHEHKTDEAYNGINQVLLENRNTPDVFQPVILWANNFTEQTDIDSKLSLRSDFEEHCFLSLQLLPCLLQGINYMVDLSNQRSDIITEGNER